MVNDIAVQDFINAIKEPPQDTNRTYNATVSHIDNEGVVWVYLQGSSKETPTASTSTEVKKGDSVTVQWRNNKLYIGGNYSNPSAGMSTVMPSVDYVTELIDNDVTVTNINAATGYIGELTSENITTENIIATNGFIKELIAEGIHADDIVADHAEIGDLDVNYAQIDMANVNNAWIENGLIKDAAISDAQILGVSANKLTAGTIDASNITVTNLNASNITTGSITVDGITIDVENNEASIDGSYIEDGTITMNGFAQEVKDVIDGAIETYTGTVVPTLNNTPASSWTTTKLKDQHIGDVYYVVNSASQQNGYCYRFTKSGSTYSWQLIKDSDVTAALQRLQTAEGKISNIESFDEEMATFKTETEGDISTLQTKTTSLETSLGDKVDKSTFNEVKQTVDGNSASITELSTITTNNGLTKTTNITNTVNTVSQTATGNSSKISSLTQTLGTNADGTTKAGDIVHQVSQIDQDLDGVTTRVSKTEVKLAGQYATSSTGAGTTAKVATITPAVTGWTLYTGATVTVKFSTANTATTPTLNVNSTGAKTIKGYKGAALTEKEYKWAANDAITFIYDGTNWLMQSSSTEATRLSTAEASISTNAGNIALKANASDVYTKTAANALLEVKANKDTLTSEINASADTVKINANRVQIDGTATFNAIKSQADAAYDAKGAAQTAVDNIDVGGRNLLVGTETSISKATTATTSYVTQVLYHTPDLKTLAELGYKVDDALTLSFDWKVTSATTYGNARIEWYGYKSASAPDTYLAPLINPFATFSASNTSGHVVTTVKLTSTTINSKKLVLRIDNSNLTLTISNLKLEKGNKATDWTPAPEDVQAEIDAKKSTHTLMSSSSGATYANILAWTAEGRENTSWGINTTATPLTNVKIGDTCRVAYKVTNMGTSDNRPYVYVIGELTNISGSTIYMTMHGLDTTIIDGGNILTNSIGANQIKVNEIEIGAAQITSGTIDTARIPNLSADKITSGTINIGRIPADALNSNISVGGRNLLLKTGASATGTMASDTNAQLNPYNMVKAYSELGLTTSDYVTLSFDYSYTNGKAGGTIKFGTNASPWEYFGTLITTTAGSNSGHIESSYKVTSALAACTGNGLRIRTDGCNGMTLTVSNVKLEKGNKATDWTPAPEDVANDNLLPDSQKMTGWRFGSSATRSTSDAFGVATLNGTTANWGAELGSSPTISTSILDGTALWLSYEYKASVASNLYICLSGSSNAEGGDATNRTKYSANLSHSHAATTEWLRSVIKMPTSLSALSSSSGNVNSLFVQFFNRTANSTVQIRKVKLERGSYASEWSSSPDDYKTYITRIDDGGIFISPSNQSPSTSAAGNSVKINGDGMEVYKGGNSVAFYGDTARIGKSGASHVDIASDSISMSDGVKEVFLVEQKTMYVRTERNYKGRQFTNSTDRHVDSWNTGATPSTWDSITVTYRLNDTSKSKKITSISNGVIANDEIYVHFNYSNGTITLTYGRGSSAASSAVLKLDTAVLYYVTDEQLSQFMTGTYPDTTLSGALRVGGGTSNSNKKNIMLLEWGGNAKFRGDISAYCSASSSGGLSLTKTEENLEICVQSDSRGTVTIDSYRVGRMVVLRIRMELAGTTAAGQRINTINLSGKHLPKPLGNSASGASYYGTHSIGLFLNYNSSASRYELAIHNASSTSFTPVSGYDLYGTLTYICEMDSSGNIEYVDD